MKPKISIIIPTYNVENTLESCLKSTTNQDYSNLELYFIDSVSTDNTLSIIKKYASQYAFIKYVSEADNGIYDAMNKGIKLCTGDWIYFLGADDTLYDNDVLSLIADKINTCNTKVVYGNVIMRGKNQWNLDNVVFNGEYDLEKFIDLNICHQAIFYHKTIFEKYGNYNTEFVTGADQDFNLRCYANTPFCYTDIIIANFFTGGHSTTVTDVKFNNEKDALIVKYFKSRIFNRAFVNSRYFIQRAALSSTSPLNLWQRLYCFAAYLKLKFQSLYIAGAK